MVGYIIEDNNLHIVDSYKVSKKRFSKELTDIRNTEPGFQVWNRGIPQMCLEWAVHNALYKLHIKRSSTKAVDLNYPQNFLERAAYAIGGVLVWIFIK